MDHGTVRKHASTSRWMKGSCPGRNVLLVECPQIVSTDLDGLTCKTPFVVRTSGVAASAEHLGRLEEEDRGIVRPRRLGGLQVDDQLEAHRSLHGQLGRFRPFEDPIT